MCSISVIICSNKPSSSIVEAVRSICSAAQSTTADVELLLVHNGRNRDASLKDLIDGETRIRLTELWLADGGKAQALNLAIQSSSASVLVFTDDDVVVPANWLEVLLEPILCDDADAVAGGSALCNDLVREWMTPKHRALLAEIVPDKNKPLLTGLNMAIQRRVFNTVPGFDTRLGPGRLGFAEDTLISIQIAAAGMKIASVPSSVVIHKPDLKRLTRKSWKRRAQAEGMCLAHIYFHYGRYRLRKAPILFVYWRTVEMLAELIDYLRGSGSLPPGEHLLNIWEKAAYAKHLLQFIGKPRTPLRVKA